MNQQLIIAALREAFDAGVEQGNEEATAWEWGGVCHHSSDSAFEELLRSVEYDTEAAITEVLT